MKTRKWIIVFALMLGFSALILYHGWNLVGANDKIKNYLLVTLQPVVGKNFTIESLDLSFGAVHLKGVNFSSQNQYLTIKVDDIRLGFNFLSLLKSGFRPQQIPQEVIFIKPHLTFHALTDTAAASTAKDMTSLEIEKQKYLQKMSDFNFIKRITVSKGKISYIDSSLNEIMMSNDINGWLSARNLANTSMRLVGKIFDSNDYNLNIIGQLNLLTGHLDSLNVILKNYEWKEGGSYVLPDYFKVSQGIIDGKVTFTEKRTDKTGFNIKGQFSISEGAFEIIDKNLYFDQVNLEAKIDEWNCEISKASLLFNGSPIAISGNIFNIINPKLDLIVQSPAFDSEKFADLIAPEAKFKISGLSSICFTVTNNLAKPKLKGELASSQLNFNKSQFQHVHTDISYVDSTLYLNNFTATLNGISIASSFEISFSSNIPTIRFLMEAQGNLFNELLQPPFQTLKNSTGVLRINGKGDVENFKGNLNFQLETFAELDTTFIFNGEFSYGQKKLVLNMKSLSHPFVADAQFDFSAKKINKKINLAGLHHLLYDFPEMKKIKRLCDFRETEIGLCEAKNRTEIHGSFLWNKNNADFERLMDLKLTIKPDDETEEIFGEAVIQSGDEPFYCDFEILKFSKILEINKIEMKKIFKCNGRILLDDEKELDLNVLFQQTPAARLADLLISDVKTINQGAIDGSLNFKGTLKAPHLSCSLSLSNLQMNNIGLYDGWASFSLNDKRFLLDSLTIKKNKVAICQTKGYDVLDTGELNFDFKAKDFAIDSTLIAIFNNENLISGTASAQLKVRGTAKAPQLSGELFIRHGKLSRFYFDTCSLTLDGSDSLQVDPEENPNMPMEKNGIGLKKMLIVRDGVFTLQGQGFIPLSNVDGLNLNFAGRGNILAILPELTSFFKSTASQAKWNFQLSGSPANIVISGGEIEIAQGYLQLGDVVPEIREIFLKAKLEQEGFLNVEYISGKVKRSDFTFRNVRSLPDSMGEKLQPFLIPNLGLNLGVFFLETARPGISMHIPGLMAKKEFGNFSFCGKNDTEKFYLAGPFQRPYVRGKVILENANFTFPFVETESQRVGPDPVVDVLRSVEWDATVLAGKDVHYQRQIPSGLDNVYLDIIIDNGVGGLSFNGILNDNSFGVIGWLESSRGNVEYLNLDFQVVKTGVEFDMEKKPNSEVDFDKTTLLPIIYGEARTTITDSTGFPYYIYLTLLTTDPYTGFAQKRGRLGEVTFQLTSESSTLGDSEGEILASLGYSPQNLRGIATDLIGISADNLVFRPLFRPFERRLEQTLGLDVVRFSSRFTRNLIEMNVSEERNFMIDSKLFLLRSTKLMVGKYLANQLFLMYSGQLEAGMDYRYQHEGFGLSHKIGLEYRINPSLLLQMEYDYNSLMLLRREDKRILLRHSFPF